MLRLNANAVNTRPIFLPVAANCNTIVALATKNQTTSSFNGVLYHWYPDFNLNRDFNAIQAATILDPDKYLNVWVVPDGFGGATTFPGTEQPTKTVLGGRSSIWRYRG